MAALYSRSNLDSRLLKRPHTEAYIGECFRVKKKPIKTNIDCSFHKKIVRVVEADIGDVVHVIKCTHTRCCCIDHPFGELFMVELLNGTAQVGHIPGDCIDLNTKYKCFLCTRDDHGLTQFGHFDQALSHLIKCHLQDQDVVDHQDYIQCPGCGYKNSSVEIIQSHFSKTHNFGELMTSLNQRHQEKLVKYLMVEKPDNKNIRCHPELKTRNLREIIKLKEDRKHFKLKLENSESKAKRFKDENEHLKIKVENESKANLDHLIIESYKVDLKMLQDANKCLLTSNNAKSLALQKKHEEKAKIKKELSKVQDDHVKTYQAFKEQTTMVETLTTKTNAKEAEIDVFKATIEKLTNAEQLQFGFEDHKECKCEATKAINDNLMIENDKLKKEILEIRAIKSCSSELTQSTKSTFKTNERK
jgi:hypothetical protein